MIASLMAECTHFRKLKGICQRFKRLGKLDHYGPLHSHDSTPRIGQIFGFAKAKRSSIDLVFLKRVVIE